MKKIDGEFWERLLQTFKVEASEHIKEIISGLIGLEKAPDARGREGLVEIVFRETHSLKGAARTVNATEIERVCRPLESIFAAFKRQEIDSSPELFDLLHRTVDVLNELILLMEKDSATSARPSLEELLERLEGVLRGEFPPTSPPSSEAETEGQKAVAPPPPVTVVSRTLPEEVQIASETVRVSTAKLNGVLLQAEELLSAKLAANQRAIELKKVHSQIAVWEKEWNKFRPGQRTLERSPDWSGKPNGHQNGHLASNPQAQRMLEFLEWNKEFIESLKAGLATLAQAADQDYRAIGMMVDNLLHEAKEVLMVPFSTLLGILPKSIRDLSRDQGKEVELVIQGEEIEIDRRILEEMKDPLIHLVRNCLDHGIEKPDERRRRGKPSFGTITIAVSRRNGSAVELMIADDGKGLDVAGVKTTAVRLGVLREEQAEILSDQDALQLAFQSGISTSPIITDLSGRGLGLTIVKEKVEKLNGSIHTETRIGAGTTFRIILPLRLATFRGVMVRLDEHLFVIPAHNVERAVRVDRAEINTVENRETIQLRDQPVALARLQQVLELPRKNDSAETANTLPVIVLISAGKRLAFLVDEVLNEQEVLVKTLGRPLVRVRNIAGATVLGTGKVVPILNVSDLIKSAVRLGAAAGRPLAGTELKSDEHRKSVLVAEDSITSRSLLKNILESAGYQVETAVDGIDAFTKLRGGSFDLVVSDVDMPRMNGLGLTAKIRGDRKFAELPVILVTALGSREDRERGIEVGANAYIVKSSFDQGNLLEVIRRLL